MRTVTTIGTLRDVLDEHRRSGATIGLVPTMGFLHDGHLSLVRRAATETDITVTTIFVNPLQFAAGEDLDSYPRDLEGDTTKARRAGTDVLFVPPLAEMYPDEPDTTVTVRSVALPLEGASRPTFFAGVATVVAKLFAIVGPCRAYFGEKDYQQLLVVRTMAADLSFPVSVVGCPIVREEDGLAMSSRNAYLDGPCREAAVVLFEALRHGARRLEDADVDPAVVSAEMEALVRSEPLARLDYVAIVDPETLAEPAPDATSLRLLVAARVGPARLIDNLGVTRVIRGG